MNLSVAEPFNWNAVVQLLTLIVIAWTAYRVEQRKKAAEEDRKKLENVVTVVGAIKEQTDGLNKALVAAEKVISKDEGKKEERAEVAERVVVADAAAVKVADKAAPIEVEVVNAPAKPVPTIPVKPNKA